MSQIKIFHMCQPHERMAGYGPHILIEFPERWIPKEIVQRLNQLSCWRGNTSNQPAKYSFWEFSCFNGRNFERAFNFLAGHGWVCRRYLRKAS